MITKLDITYDVHHLWQACCRIIDAHGDAFRYISLTHRAETTDPHSRLREPNAFDLDRDGVPRTIEERGEATETYTREEDFTELNELCRGTYIEQIVQAIPQRLGSLRIMRLPSHRCYGIHRDLTMRIHLPLVTNPQALMIFPDDSLAVHLPANGHMYLLDTTKPHTAMNGGPDRYHIVGALLN